MSPEEYDLFVIGGGSGGVRAARLAAQLGKRVAVAEESRYGGTCVIRGCVPKKLFVYASQAGAETKKSRDFGWIGSHPEFNWSTLRAAKDREIARLEALYRKSATGHGVTIIDDRAVLCGEERIHLLRQNKTVKAKHILVATGAKPAELPGLIGHEHCVTSDDIFDLERLPASALIIGGGYIAVEFAGILSGLGVETTVVYRGERVLRGFDEEIRDRMTNILRDRGVRVILNTMPSEVTAGPGGRRVVTLSDNETVATDLVMVAVGRRPNTDGLGLDVAGIEHDDGRIIVDEFGRTNAANVYAIGDVTNREQLTPVAIHEATCLIDTLFRGSPRAPDKSSLATAVFSQPEIGCIGLTEQEASARFEHVRVFARHFRPMKSTITGDGQEMFMKLLVNGQNDRVIGAHILGDGAAEMAQLVAVAMKAGATKAHFDTTMAVHPTAAEELVTLYDTIRTLKKGNEAA